MQPEAVSNAFFKAFEAALFLYGEEKCARKKKKPQKEAKRGTTKRGSKNPRFESYTITQRIGLRGIQGEQIQANSSFFRAIAEFFNI